MEPEGDPIEINRSCRRRGLGSNCAMHPCQIRLDINYWAGFTYISARIGNSYQSEKDLPPL